jgi:hypothetical protein
VPQYPDMDIFLNGRNIGKFVGGAFRAARHGPFLVGRLEPSDPDVIERVLACVGVNAGVISLSHYPFAPLRVVDVKTGDMTLTLETVYEE